MSIWHQLRLLLPTPANALRKLSEKYTFIYRSLGAVFVGVPPVVVSSYYQVTTFSEEFRKGWPALSTLLDKHVLIACILSGLWVYIAMWFRRALASFVDNTPPGWEIAPSTVLKAIDNVVGAKQQRFSSMLTDMDTAANPYTASQIFTTITQPTQQISELIKAVYSTFEVLLRQNLQSTKFNLKTNLAIINQAGEISAIRYYYPSNHPVRSTIEALNNPSSTIRKAVATKKPVIIESTQAESAKANPRFIVSDPAFSQEDGSLICYPVILAGLNSVIFVLSIYVDVPGAFKHRQASALGEVIEPFALRLKLEYALLAMKEVTPT